MTLHIQGISTDDVRRLRDGGPDANGQPPLVRVAEGVANLCRDCLGLIAAGDDKLVLAYRPFDRAQPYAETGPIFLHRASCPRYDGDDWIRYDTGDVVRGPEITAACRTILADPTVAYVHVRSKFNCFQCRVDRG